MGSVKVGSARWGGGRRGPVGSVKSGQRGVGGGRRGPVGSVKVGSARWGGQEGSGGVSEGRDSARNSRRRWLAPSTDRSLTQYVNISLAFPEDKLR